MPLIHSASKDAFSSNVAEMMKAGHPQAQSLAAAYRVQRSSHAAGGGIAAASFATGGAPPVPTFIRREAGGEQIPSGLIHSNIPGRTDKIEMSPPGGSYVIPADVVSGLGEGNTLAGAKHLDLALRSGPWGTSAPAMAQRGMPRAPGVLHEARGGGVPKPVPIIAAGGEYVVSPADVRALGSGNMKKGHEILDAFVLHIRKKTADTMRKLPGPKKS